MFSQGSSKHGSRRVGRQHGSPWWAAHARGGGCPGPVPNTRFHLTAPPRDYVDDESHGGGAAGEAGR